MKIDGFAKKHLPQSVELYEFIAWLDCEHGNDMFGFKAGGDGDNGEVLMDYFDAYFLEPRKRLKSRKAPFHKKPAKRLR